MKNSSFFMIAIIGFFLPIISVCTYAGTVPRDFDDIPVYPGAAFGRMEKQDASNMVGPIERDADGGMFVISRTEKRYGVNTNNKVECMNEIVNFYKRNLGGPLIDLIGKYKIYGVVDAERKWGENLRNLKPGSISPILLVGIPNFKWYVREGNGNLTCYYVQVVDNFGQSGLREKEIAIIIAKEIYTKKRPEVATPTEKELGVPLYPGAVLNPKESSVSKKAFYYTYYTNASPETVKVFYEKALGTTFEKTALSDILAYSKENYLGKNYPDVVERSSLTITRNTDKPEHTKIEFECYKDLQYSLDDEKGCSDHPLFKRMPKYVLDGCYQTNANLEVRTGADKNKIIEGRVTRLMYRFPLKQGIPDCSYDGQGIPKFQEVKTYYENIIIHLGGKKLYEKMYQDPDEEYVSFSLPRGGKNIWVILLSKVYGDDYAGSFTLDILE